MLVRKKFTGPEITVKLKEIQKGIDEVESSDWDKLELAMKQAGWKMVYDGPAYNESYDSYYTITKGKKK